MNSYAFFHRAASGDCNVLIPSDQDALDMLLAHEPGKEIRVTMSGARNPRQHRLFFALAKLTAENDPYYNGNVEKCRKDILRKCGHVDYEIDRDGHAHIVVKSIAFDKLSQAEFDPLFRAAVNVVCEWLGNQPKEIIDECNKMIADKRYEGYRR